MNACQREPDLAADAQRRTAQLCDEFREFVGAEAFGGGGGGSDRGRLISRLDDHRARAVSAKRLEQAEDVAGLEVQAGCDGKPRLAFGEKPVEEGTCALVGIAIGRERKVERQEGHAAGVGGESLFGVGEPQPSLALAVDDSYQSAFWRVARTPKSLRMRRILRSYPVSLPCSSSDRYVRLRPAMSASSAWVRPACWRYFRIAGPTDAAA